MILLGYLVKVSLCMIVFLLLHGVVWRHTTFFQLNRYYLLIGIVASFIIPGITISSFTQPYNLLQTELVAPAWVEKIYTEPTTNFVEAVGPAIDYSLLLYLLYFTGMFILLFRLVSATVDLIGIVNTHDAKYIDRVRIVRSKQLQACTFFGTIILPEHEVDPAILIHENAHVKQKHWIDLVLIEITCVILWFNPLVLLYRRAIKQQHEYLADAHTLDSGITIEHYFHCLLTQIQLASSFVLSNKFYSKSIKSRIMMMTKNKTPLMFRNAYLLLIPVLCLILVSFTSKPVVDAVALPYAPVAIESVSGSTGTEPSIAPIHMEKAKISAPYGERIHPATGKKQFHTGIDLLLAEGEDVMTTANGLVIESSYDSLRGNYIVVKHDAIFVTSYSHLKSNLVKAGDRVQLGQKIGYVGSTGVLSTGPHLHYEVIKNGKPVDPKGYLPN